MLVQHCHPQLYSTTTPGSRSLLELHHYIALSTAVLVPLQPLFLRNRLLPTTFSEVVSLLLDPPTHTYSRLLSFTIRYKFLCISPLPCADTCDVDEVANEVI